MVLIYGPVVMVHGHRALFPLIKQEKCGLYHGSPGESVPMGRWRVAKRGGNKPRFLSRLASGAWGGYRARPVLGS